MSSQVQPNSKRFQQVQRECRVKPMRGITSNLTTNIASTEKVQCWFRFLDLLARYAKDSQDSKEGFRRIPGITRDAWGIFEASHTKCAVSSRLLLSDLP